MLENMRTIRIRWGPSRGIFEENIQFLNFQMEIMLTLVYLNLKTRVQSVSRARGVSSINYFLDNIFKTLKCRTVGRQNVLKDKNKLNNCIIWLGTIPETIPENAELLHIDNDVISSILTGILH